MGIPMIATKEYVMRRWAYLCLGLLLAAMPAGAREGNQMTIYNNDLALVEQVRAVRWQKAYDWVAFKEVAAQLIPASVQLRQHDRDRGFAVSELNFRYALAKADNILSNALGQRVEVIDANGTLIAGVLLDARQDLLVLKTKKGIRILKWNGRMTLSLGPSGEALPIRPVLTCRVAAKEPGEASVDLSYLTRGVSWQADYVGIINPAAERMDLNAWVTVDNHCGTSFKNTWLRFVAGQPHRAPRPVMPEPKGGERAMAMAAPPQVREQTLFEYHSYALDSPSDLADGQIKQLALFQATGVVCRRQYTFDAAQDPTHIQARIAFSNLAKEGLGRPLPAGTLRLFQMDPGGLAFIGEDRIDHTARNEKVEVTVGGTFDLSGERRMLARQKLAPRSEKQTIEVELHNNKADQDVDVRVIEHLYQRDWQIETANFKYQRKSADTVEFTIPVKANAKVQLRYTVRYQW
jgi:hypothetical protein